MTAKTRNPVLIVDRSGEHTLAKVDHKQKELGPEQRFVVTK